MNLQDYTLPQLQQLGARIAKQIAKQESAGKASVLKRMKDMAREHGLTLEEVLGAPSQAKPQKVSVGKAFAAPKAPLPIKYRHPSNKDLAWSGRGRRPGWVDAWLANGGALEALATAAQRFEKKQSRKALEASDAARTEAPVEAESALQG